MMPAKFAAHHAPALVVAVLFPVGALPRTFARLLRSLSSYKFANEGPLQTSARRHDHFHRRHAASARTRCYSPCAGFSRLRLARAAQRAVGEVRELRS